MTSAVAASRTGTLVNSPPFRHVRDQWAGSKWFRRALIVYTVLRSLMQLILLAGVFAPDQDASLSLPDDLRIYLEASQNVQDQVDLYPALPIERMEFYQYAPSFAVAFVPFQLLPTGLTVILHTLLHVAIYALLYVFWGRIFSRAKFESGLRMLARTLPLWLIFAPFWSDLGYLNVYLLMALLATLLINAVLRQNLAASVLWAVIILQIKPQWAFMLFVPLILGQWRFTFKLLLSTVAAYGVITAATVLLLGTEYAGKQYADYFQLLVGIGSNYPWRTPDMPFLGYNHSIIQTAVYMLGSTPDTLRLALVIKSLIVLPLVVIALRSVLRPAPQTTFTVKLDWAFALYCAAFIWLDVVWELSLSIVVFTYLLATTSNRPTRALMWLVFLPYALVDVIQVLSYIIFGDEIVVPGPYVLTDPSIYVPLTMIVTVVFFAILIRRLWLDPSHKNLHLTEAD